MRKKHTIKDIAQAAGVSIGTVDRVLHNRGKVSKKALEKVKKALTELEYRPNPIARTLKNNTIYQVAVLFPSSNKDPFWGLGYEGIQEVIQEYDAFDVDITVHLFDPSDPTSFLKNGLEILEQQVDAFLFVPLFEKESNQLLDSLNEKKVLTGTFNSFHGNDVDLYVGLDLFMSGRVAAKLIADSIKASGKIAIVHIDETYSNAIHLQEKENGFRSYFEENPTAEIVTLNLKSQGFESKFERFVDEYEVEAFFITTSKSYIVVKALCKLDLKNVVVGYDLLEENVKYLESDDINFLIHQSPKLQATLGLKALVEKLLLGKELTQKNLLPIQIVNSENVGSYQSPSKNS